jgi:NTE family protein
MGLSGGKKIGLALGGGAAWGLAHIGVLKALEKADIPIDMIAGTSAGALTGTLYAQGKSAARIEKLALEQLDWKKLPRLIDFTLPRTGLIAGKHLMDLMRKIIGGDLDFADLKIPFACIATDIDTGEEVMINHGSVVQAVRASISIPAIFAVDSFEGQHLVDGSLTNPVPVNIVREMGADFVIAVNVLPVRFDNLHQRGERAIAEHNIFNVLMHSLYIAIHSMVLSCLEDADYVIQPQVAHIGPSEFLRAHELILHGELAAQAAIPEIKSKLKV